MIDLEKVLTADTIEDVIYYLDISLNESGGDDSDLQPTRDYIQQLLDERDVLLGAIGMVTPRVLHRFLPQPPGITRIEATCVYCNLLIIEPTPPVTTLVEHDATCLYVLLAQILEKAGRSKP